MEWKDKRKKEIDALFNIIEEKYSIDKEALLKNDRKKRKVLLRRAFMNIIFELFYVDDQMTHNEIAEIVERDRASFIHHRKQHLNLYDTYKDYQEEYDLIKTQFQEKIKS